jgi:hypothetical protein
MAWTGQERKKRKIKKKKRKKAPNERRIKRSIFHPREGGDFVCVSSDRKHFLTTADLFTTIEDEL